ncbi:serine/threonine-protein phosphatase 4 regulatory subunit 2 [Punica granatum]|uniref:Serine/threonine-protein phosphatase 4 regulatory subunit 2 n=2 Tax=Punica granatum TaxID=22663 RepID=A0A6P8DJD8_PUNGR|nr:serine/threonine-protein phosphatase 4 regulatory subunit 2 [Punica granatum]PKI54644.1 hypothetical protein CRG98_024995 [Punica granatum]
MVVSLRPGKFYGSSLPRPRFVKHNSERVDPPVPVLDPLLSWAAEAHWSMGGLSFNRLRLQGRIEGNVKRLREHREREIRKQAKLPVSPKGEGGKGSSGKKRVADSPSPPPAPIAAKRRRRYMALIDEDEESEEEEVEEKVVVEDDEDEDNDSDEEEADEEEEPVVRVVNKKPARKLYEEFNRVADKRRSEGSNRAGGDEVMKVVAELNREHPERNETEGSPNKGKKVRQRSGSSSGTRTSPRLAKAVEMSLSPRSGSSRRLVKRGYAH